MNGASFDAVVAHIADDYDVLYDECERDARAFFGEAIYQEPYDLKDWDSLEKGHANKLAFPLRVEFELTALCNWHCGFCYNVWKIDPNLSDREVMLKSKSLKNKNASKADMFRMLDECAANNVFVVRYSGGETMLNPDFFDVIEYGAKKRLYQVVFTNGHFLDREAVERLSRNNVREILISLHGLEDTHNLLAKNKNAYRKATAAIECCVENRISVVVESILVKDSIQDLPKIIDHLSHVGVTEWRIMRYVATGKNDEFFVVDENDTFEIMKLVDSYIQSNGIELHVGWPCSQRFCTSSSKQALSSDDPTLPLRRRQIVNHCEAGIAWCSVSFDGKLRICPHSDRYFGDATQPDGIGRNWQNMTDVVWDVVEKQGHCQECSQCAVLKACRGGCHLESFLGVHD
jgi:radical SAM protein with 4Fe4S-binding SPASM domain